VQGTKTCRKVAGNEAGRAGDLGGEGLVAGLRVGVAVDADEGARRPQRLGHEPRVPAAAEGAVDGDLSRPGRQQLDQLGGEDWFVLGWHVDKGCAT
jgi:hypothetical protein